MDIDYTAKSKVLVSLLKCGFFASSPSSLATICGVKNKTSFIRVAELKAGPRAVDNCWRLILKSFGLDEDTLIVMPDVWSEAKELSESKEFGENIRELVASASDKRTYMTIVLALAFHKKFNPYGPSREACHDMIQYLNSLLFSIYPENNIAHSTISEMTAYMQPLLEQFRNWFFLVDIGCQALTMYKEKIDDYFQPSDMGFGKRSWWITAESEQNEHAELFLMCDVGNYYCALHYHADIHSPVREFTPDCDCIFMTFVSAEKIVACKKYSNKKDSKNCLLAVDCYVYELNDNMLSFSKMSSSFSDIPYDMPSNLVRVVPGSKWFNWCKDQNNDEIEQILVSDILSAVNYEITDYYVTDVSVGRNGVSVSFDKMESVFIPYSDCQLLRKISAFDDVVVARDIVTNELVLLWSTYSITYKLSNPK